MRLELRCDDARRELSARLDGEADASLAEALETHLARCAGCWRHEADLVRVRTGLRVQAAERVPDLAAAIMARVEAQGHRARRSDEWWMRSKIAALAGGIAALLLAGVTTLWLDRPAGVARAGEIVDQVRRAARALETYKATFEITERGWHPAVPKRNFRARVYFDAPDRFRLQVRDLTTYPDPLRWPANDVDVIADPRRWWIKEPLSCPRQALPGCSRPAETTERSIVRREPFDGARNLPTDIVVPLETLASSETFKVAYRSTIAGRAAYRIRLSYREAIPLVTALETGGSWRELYPLDEVVLWIDRETWFPLRFVVRANTSHARALWAATRSLQDRPGSIVLAVKATAFSEPRDLSPSLFEVPRAVQHIDGGFRRSRFEDAAAFAPTRTAGLTPYRAGRSHGRTVLAYADGITWLKVTVDGSAARRSLNGIADPAGSEQVRMNNGGYGYYHPASESFRRQVDIYARGVHAHLESNLPRSELLDVASSMRIVGRRLSPRGVRAPGLTISLLRSTRAIAARSMVRLPAYLPEGYDPAHPSAALLYHSRQAPPTVVVYYRQPEAEYDGFGIRVTQSRAQYLPPSSEQFVPVRIHDDQARYFAERNELEWIDDGVYRSVAAPSFDLSTVVAIAGSLR